MNHIVQGSMADSVSPSGHFSMGLHDPIEAATRAVEGILAAAHEAGHAEAVRLLHAVTALLSAAPRQ